MLTPPFLCSQDDRFIIVVITLSALCKVSTAVFDISDNQFTMYCKPCYLRLRFDQLLREGAGERATFDVGTQQLTVYLPKATAGEPFHHLDNPQYLLATEKQRAETKRLVVEIGKEDGVHSDCSDEVEFIQDSSLEAESEECHSAYGFANAFHGLFAKVDPDLVSEIVDVPFPDITPGDERRKLRVTQENQDFDLDAVLLSIEDDDGAVDRLLHYVPEHIRDFQKALQEDSIVYIKSEERKAVPNDAYEQEEEKHLPGDGVGEVWRGNVMEFSPPVVVEVSTPSLDRQPPVSVSTEESNVHTEKLQDASSTILAVPRRKPVLEFSQEEFNVLRGVSLPKLFFPPSRSYVVALTSDLLFAEAYDNLFSEGSGCCESVWNICKLSSSLSFLDPPETMYESCYFFSRRLLTYALHRHPAIPSRIFALVGSRMLLGGRFVVRALLRIRSVLSHSEHKHILCAIFLDPLIAYWMNAADADNAMEKAAIELHEHATRVENRVVYAASSVNVVSASRPKCLTLKPLTIHNLGLPLSDEET
eukprot:gene2021-1211_t